MRTILLMLLATCMYGADFRYSDCNIQARLMDKSTITKRYQCKQGSLSVSGGFAFDEKRGYMEFGDSWFGERRAFGVKRPVARRFRDCSSGLFGQRANYDGYQTLEVRIQCGPNKIILQGIWTVEIQGHWEYRLDLGEVVSSSWIDDPTHYILDASSYQEWCPTEFGFRLCGWREKPFIDHGNAPPLKRSK